MNKPYEPSLIDRLTEAVDSLPGPVWAGYATLMVASWALLHLLFWIDGGLPVGSIATDPVIVLFPLYQFFWLILYDYLSRVASRSLAAYRPLLEVDDSAVAALDFRLRTLPLSFDWALIPLAILLEIAIVISAPPAFGSVEIRTIMPLVGDFVATGFLNWTFLAVLVRTIRQLRLVAGLHSQATNIDLLDLRPAHAFSRLTARTGLALGLFVATTTLTTSNPANLLDFALIGSLVMLAIAVFVVPLLGMRTKLVAEKDRAMDEVSELIHSVTSEMNIKVRDHNYEGVSQINEALAGLLRQRDLLEGIPTWPWEPGTLRGFASTLVLPVCLWIVTRLLERIF